jgi:phosphoribosyl-ATP pyrophosphohydrolase/phosphoribosyl-AMP cyclohydrolase
MPDERKPSGAATLDLDALDFAKGNGLVTVVAQDVRSGAVLMVAHADREALERTIATGEMHYRSRTRGAWHKGATSGNVQRVVALLADCDGDAVLARVEPAGPACHTGDVSCFGGEALAADALGTLAATIEARAAGAGGANQVPGARGAPPREQSRPGSPEPRNRSNADRTAARPSYTARLLGDRNLRLKKLGEEAAELVTACADEDAERAAEEGVDLLYHALVALRATGVTLDDLRRVARGRATGSA